MGSLSERLTPAPRKQVDAAARGSGVRAALFLAFAAVAALGAGVLFKGYLDRRALSGAIQTAKVVVAAVEIPVATALRDELMTTVEWPRAHLPDGAQHDPKALVGKVALAKIPKGDAILKAKLATGEAGEGLSAILPEAMRAVSVRVDDVVGVAGFIHPGDSVDVVVTMKPKDDSEALPTAKVILQNVKVLAVGKELDRKNQKLDKAVPVTVATLMVDCADSEKLALASTKGQILLALRSRLDTTPVETAGITPPELLKGSEGAEKEPAPAPRPATATTRPVARPAIARKPVEERPRPEHEVEILRGDLFEKRQFQNRGGKE